jgi:hypothetical protein
MFQEVGDGRGGDGMMVKVGAGGHHQETKPQMVHKERLTQHHKCKKDSMRYVMVGGVMFQ